MNPYLRQHLKKVRGLDPLDLELVIALLARVERPSAEQRGTLDAAKYVQRERRKPPHEQSPYIRERVQE